MITIAPSRQHFSEGNLQAPIVAFVRQCGNIKHRAKTTTGLLSIDDTTLCDEISLQELEEQHTDYNASAACKRWRREARLPMLGTTEQQDDETEYSPETSKTPERPKKRNLAEQQMEDRKRQRQEISKLQEFAAVTNPGTEEQGAPTNSEKRKVPSSERQQTRKKTRGSPANHDSSTRSQRPHEPGERKPAEIRPKGKRKKERGKGHRQRNNKRDFK